MRLFNDYLVDSPSPVNLSYFYSFGSLLGLTLVVLVLSGVSLAMHYSPNTELAFASVEEVIRAVNNGWLFRYVHANGAGLFFIWVYLHIGRNLFYGSYRQPRGLLWAIGVMIFIAMMATAFIGYVLPWGQMSLWGATVITNLLSAIPLIGSEVVAFIWGGYSVDNPTLNRLFGLHFLLPFLLLALVVFHLIALHHDASNNPVGLASLTDRIRFHPYFTSKDLVGFILMAAILGVPLFYAPNYFGHPDNSIPANALITPHSIVPEWYFLPFYAILRAIPNKVLGVAALATALLILLPLPWLSSSTSSRSGRYRPIHHFLLWAFVGNFLFLLWLGACPIAQPFIHLGQLSTWLYFTLIVCIAAALLTAFLLKRSIDHLLEYYLIFGALLINSG